MGTKRLLSFVAIMIGGLALTPASLIIYGQIWGFGRGTAITLVALICIMVGSSEMYKEK